MHSIKIQNSLASIEIKIHAFNVVLRLQYIRSLGIRRAVETRSPQYIVSRDQ